MKIATFNINGINARLNILLHWLENSQADIACLQELKAPNEKFPEEQIRNAGYDVVWHGQKSWNGVAILSRKHPIKEIGRVLSGNSEDVQSRYLEVDINGLRIVCIYLPNGNPAPGPKFDYKLNWLDRLLKRMEELISLQIPVIICGDFNIIPTEKDVYKPERWTKDALFRPEVREYFEKMQEQGWVDAMRQLYPDETIYTFWDYFRSAFKRNAGLRIDHFLLSPQIAGKLKAFEVEASVRAMEKPSDHAPVWIEI